MHRLGQEDQNNFLTDQMSRFWLTSGVRAPGSAQKRHLEALVDRFLPDPSADARTPQNGVLSALSPHDRSKKGNAIGKQSTRSIHTKRSLSECSMDHPSTARSEEHWDRTFMVSVDTRPTTALQRALFGAPPGP